MYFLIWRGDPPKNHDSYTKLNKILLHVGLLVMTLPPIYIMRYVFGHLVFGLKASLNRAGFQKEKELKKELGFGLVGLVWAS